LDRKSGDAVTKFAGNDFASARFSTQTSLIAGIRRGDERAIRDLFLMYAPLLRDQARKMSVPPSECRTFVETLLGDVAIHLAESDVAPRELARYLVSALRNRVRTRHRDESRQDARKEVGYAEYGQSTERIVAECHSEYGMRNAQQPGTDGDVPLRSAIAKLAMKSACELTPEELTMMMGVGRHVPLRDLAEQLGITYGAARVRLSRLRARFLKLALQYLRTLEETEAKEMERFFRRAGVLERNAEHDQRKDIATTCERSPTRERS
jgi:DNA-binding Lrp family transcriptional regulator